MQIDLSIDESDVGQIREGLPVQFTVDAFPNRNFTGTVYQVRLSATNLANVVTYPVVVEVANPDLVLLPGMTANAEIEITSRADALRVPNAALRFKPEGIDAPAPGGMGGGGGGAGMGDELKRIAATLDLKPEQQAALDQVLTAMRERAAARQQAAAAGGGGSPGGNGSGAAPSPEAMAAMRERFQRMFKESMAPFRDTLDDAQRKLWDREIDTLQSARRVNLWTLKDGKPSAVTVRAGVSDSSHTEVLGGGIEPGTEVIIGAGGP
jgi:HlyD family secretion protein